MCVGTAMYVHKTIQLVNYLTKVQISWGGSGAYAGIYPKYGLSEASSISL